jgi:hypothetical protein
MNDGPFRWLISGHQGHSSDYAIPWTKTTMSINRYSSMAWRTNT